MSGFLQETNSILLAYWSQRQRASRSCTYWLLCTTSSTILAQCLKETSRRGFFWVDIDLAIRKGLTFYQTRSNAIILQGKLPAYCIPKVVRLKTGEVLYEKSYMSPRPPPKISLRHDHDWTRGNDELGSTVEQQPVGKIVRQSCGEVQRATFSQPNQKPNQSVIDQGNLIARKMCLLLKVKRPVPMRSMKKVFTENSVLQIDQGNLIICLKTPVLSKLTMDQGNLMRETAQVHTQWKNNLLLKKIVTLRYSIFRRWEEYCSFMLL